MADAITQLLLAAKHTTEQALTVARVEGDTRDTAHIHTALAALNDAADARIRTPRPVAA